MALYRGTYGIEYDEQPRSPLRKFWGVFILIPVAALALLFLRGCGDEKSREQEGEDGIGQTRYRVSEESRPERPSIWQHFLLFRKQSAGAAGAPVKAVPEAALATSLQEPQPLTAANVQSEEVRKLLDQAAALEGEDDLVAARRVLLQVLLRRDAEDVRGFVERKISGINTTLLFDDRPAPEKVQHRVAAGDLIGKLAKAYGNTQEYLLKANGIDRPQSLRIGRRIWALKNPQFELTVFKRNNRAVLTVNGQFFKSYAVGIGRPENVPSGTYAIRRKTKNPAQNFPETGSVAFGNPRNVLGTRWIALSATGATPEARSLGLHGTWNESTLGRPADMGRVRFRNADIEELCLLLPTGTAVNMTE